MVDCTGGVEGGKGVQADPAVPLVCTGGKVVEAFSVARNTSKVSGLRRMSCVQFGTC